MYECLLLNKIVFLKIVKKTYREREREREGERHLLSICNVFNALGWQPLKH